MLQRRGSWMGLVAVGLLAGVGGRASAAVYGVGDTGVFGNGEQWDSVSNGLTVDSTDDTYAAGFTVFDAVTIDRVWQRYVSVVGDTTPIAVNIDIQTDDGSGNPSGTSVATTTLDLSGNGTKEALFSSAATLNPGVYHVVTSSADVNASRRFNVAASTTGNDIRPHDRRLDPAMHIATRADGAAAWTADTRDPFLILGNGSPVGGPGQPYTTERFDTFKTGDVAGGDVRSYGQKFSITDVEVPSGAAVEVASITMAANAVDSPTDDLAIQLRSDDGTILASTSMTAAQADKTAQTLTLDQTATLSEGVEYLLTTEYAGDGFYGLRSFSMPTGLGSGSGEATWGGLSMAPIFSEDAWDTRQNSVPIQDLGFSFTGQVIPEPGSLGLMGVGMVLVLGRGKAPRR